MVFYKKQVVYFDGFIPFLLLGDFLAVFLFFTD